MVDWQLRIVQVSFLPSPIIGNLFVIYENQINLTRKRTNRRSICEVAMFGNSAVTTPASTPRVFILVGTQSLENGRWGLEDRRDDLPTLLGLPHAPAGNRLHPAVGNHYLTRRSVNRIDGGNGKVLAAGVALFWHNRSTLPDKDRQGKRGMFTQLASFDAIPFVL
jgi:hypothetical protein